MAGTTMDVNIVSAEHPIWSGTAKAVLVPAYAGGLGILPGHEPVLSVIQEGPLVVTEPDGAKHSFEVTDGFISFDSNKLTVVVEQGRSMQNIPVDETGIQ